METLLFEKSLEFGWLGEIIIICFIWFFDETNKQIFNLPNITTNLHNIEFGVVVVVGVFMVFKLLGIFF